MIQAIELRISNLAEYNGEFNTVAELFNISNSSHWNPIPLTEEWLIKFYFEAINHIHGYRFYTLSQSKKNKIHIDVYDNKTVYMGHTIKNIEYVHQLQNLYFALTGQELTIKE